MDEDLIQRLDAHLRTFVVPQTGRPLGESGTRLDVADQSGRLVARVECGFPVSRAGESLREAIARHCAALELAQPLEVSVSWSVTSHKVQHGLKPLDGVRNIIAVASGKGGVGKSTVSTNLAVALGLEGGRVGLLDADIYGPSQPRILGLTGRRPESRDGKTMEPIEAFGIRAMSVGFLVDEKQPMAWRGPMVTSALNQLLTQTNWGDLDYLVIDMPPGTGDIQLTLAQRVPVSGAVIVTTPQDVALSDARKGLEMFEKVNVPILGVIENMGLHVCSNCGHEEHIFGTDGGGRLADDYGVPMLGTLPLDGSIREMTDRGEPPVVAEPDGAAARSFVRVALRVAGELAAHDRDYSHVFPTITVEDD